jgi:hypothetical protein
MTLGGINRDDVVSTPDNTKRIWVEADATIEVGEVVVLDAGNSTDGRLLVDSADAGEDWLAIGIYTGSGGTGVETTDDGLKGRQALDGDQIEVCVAGAINALTDGSSNTIEDLDPLQLAAAGKLVELDVSTATTGNWFRFIALEQTGSDGNSRVWVNGAMS